MAIDTGFEHFVERGAPLAPRTWLALGGPAEYLASPTSVEELAELVERCNAEEMPVRVLGAGSNVLVGDAGVTGVVIDLEAPCFQGVSTAGNKLSAAGGVPLSTVISSSVRAGLAGLETLVGIPGTVGGALHANSGSKGGDIGPWVCEATVMTRTGEVRTRTSEELVFAYRQSSLDELVILEAVFELTPDDPQQLTKRMQKQWIIKRSGQPMSHERSALVWKNPRGLSAGALIDQAGLKGASSGGVEVSKKHAGFVLAHDGATSEDVLDLIELVRSRVAERLGVELETELEIW